MSEVKVVRRWPRMRCVADATVLLPNACRRTPPAGANAGIEFIGIGASTSEARRDQKLILDGLPKGFSVPLLIVQLIARGFLGAVACNGSNHATPGLKFRSPPMAYHPQPSRAYLGPGRSSTWESTPPGQIVLC